MNSQEIVNYKPVQDTFPYLETYHYKGEVIFMMNEGKVMEAFQVVPNMHLMPPPPHSGNNNGNYGYQMKRGGSWKSNLSVASGLDSRSHSPHGSESDESLRSYRGRDSPPQGNSNKRSYVNRNGGKNGEKNGAVYNGNALVFNKFSTSAPSIFHTSTMPSGNNDNRFKPKYYTNSYINTTRNHHHHNNHHNNNNHNHNHNNNNNTTNNNNNSRQLTKHTKDRIPAFDVNRRVHGLMERFVSRVNQFRIKMSPAQLLHGNEFDGLNRSIWDVYIAKAQRDTTYLNKLQLWKKVYLSIRTVYLRYGLFLVGSTMSGLGLDSSDIDMCLLVRNCLPDARDDAIMHLKILAGMLEQCDFIKKCQLITAKVPILKFTDSVYGFEVDLNCNNSVGIRNTRLLICYTQMDWRVRPLVAIVKLWAQANNINDAKRMTISSYSLALMVIHYLQCGVTPPAIPCLQGMYPSVFSPDVKIQTIDLQEDLPIFHSDNKQSLAELFLGFLGYYACFDYDQYAISIRVGCVLPKNECRFARSPKNDSLQWKLLCIEEPFDLTNTARSVYDVVSFEHIKGVFRASFETLKRTKSLSTILPCVPAK